MKASDLLLLDSRKTPEDYGDRVDPTAWWIHGAMHRSDPQARCIVHLHLRYATALSVLQDPALPPVDQTTCRFLTDLRSIPSFDGMGLGNEAERLSTMLGNKRMVMMGKKVS